MKNNYTFALIGIALIGVVSVSGCTVPDVNSFCVQQNYTNGSLILDAFGYNGICYKIENNTYFERKIKCFGEGSAWDDTFKLICVWNGDEK